MKKADGEEPATHDEVIDWLTSLAGDGVKIRIGRVKEDGTWALRDVRTKEAITDDYLLHLPEGNYRLVAFGANGKYIQSRTLSIDDTDKNRQKPEPVVNGNGSDGEFFDRFLLLMQNQNVQAQQQADRTIQMFLQMNQSTTTILTTVLTGMFANKGESGNGVDIASKILELSEKFSSFNTGAGPKDWTTVLAEIAKEAAPAVLPALMAPRPGPGSVSSPMLRELPPDLPQQVPVPEPVPVPAPVPVPQNALADKIRQLWGRVLNAGLTDIEPEGTAQTILDLEEFLGDEAAGVFITTIEQSTDFASWNKVVQIPEKLKPWFGRFYDEVKKQLSVSTGGEKGGNADASENDSNTP